VRIALFLPKSDLFRSFGDRTGSIAIGNGKNP
jgi:hypothetical protein